MDRRMRRGWRPRATDLAFALLFGGVLPAPPPVAGPVAAAEETVLNLARPPVGPAPASCSGIDTAGNGGLALTQTFRDDFDSFDLGAGVWTPHFDHNDYADWRGRTLTGNNELQIYVDPGYAGAGKAPLGLDPFKAERGILEIRAEPVPAALRPLLQDLPYMSGIITSRKSLLQRYGYFEITAKLPAGQGLWPAFWLLSPGQWPPEIDVLEYLGGRPGGVELHIHWSEGGHKSGGCRVDLAGATTGFHRYGVLWQRQAITWYIDRQPVAWIASRPGMDRPMYLLANLAVGGTWGGRPDAATKFPAAYQIDAIAVWQFTEFMQ